MRTRLLGLLLCNIIKKKGGLKKKHCINNSGLDKLFRAGIKILLLFEQNIVSPFLSFFSFWPNLKRPVALYIVCEFHDEWTKINGPKWLRKNSGFIDLH